MGYDVTFIAKVFPLLNDIFDTYLAPIWNGRLYNQVRPVGSQLPAAVYQSQDGGGVNDDSLNTNGWTGLITFRAMGLNDNDNWVRLGQLLEILPTIEETLSNDDFDVSVKADKPMSFPVDRLSSGNVYTAGVIVRFWVRQK